jgi:hypothetical protein
MYLYLVTRKKMSATFKNTKRIRDVENSIAYQFKIIGLSYNNIFKILFGLYFHDYRLIKRIKRC